MNRTYFTMAFLLIQREVKHTAASPKLHLQIDAHDHVVPLDIAVGKIKLFNIGMSASTSSAFTIKYVLKKVSLWTPH
jgi:hypothetical protein